jgi:hypothetical protein
MIFSFNNNSLYDIVSKRVQHDVSEQYFFFKKHLKD